jgi:hypothetical protein
VPAWSGQASLVKLFDRLVCSLKARQLAAQLPPFTPGQLRQLVLLARHLDAKAARPVS